MTLEFFLFHFYLLVRNLKRKKKTVKKKHERISLADLSINRGKGLADKITYREG